MLNLGLGLGVSKPRGANAPDERTLDQIESSVVFELDAGNTDSYPGTGEEWLNVTASPADGELQTAYDFEFGFNQTPGDVNEPTWVSSGLQSYMEFNNGS